MSATADQMLSRLSDAQLRDGIKRGRDRLALLDAMEGLDDLDWDGPFPPTKSFETWEANFTENRRRLLKMAIRDCRRELDRRSAPTSDPQP